MFFSVFLFALVLVPNIGYGAFPPLRSLGSAEMSNAAFAQILHNKVSGRDDLVVSSFAAFGADTVYAVRDIQGKVANKGGNFDPTDIDIVTQELPWPNELEEVPTDVLNRDDLWWCGAGFLVPNKDDGKIAILEVTSSGSSVIHDITTTSSPDRTKWWYHHVAWHDMNLDGRKDALTSRAILDSVTGIATAEMVWFEQPSTDALYSTWTEHVLFSGPDAGFTFEEMNVAGQIYNVIISTQYFAEELVISWIEPDGSWTDPSTIQHRVIAAVVDERYFHAELVDLNKANDGGRPELLVSVNSDYNGKLVVFEIPADFRFAEWTRHDLATGFKPQGRVITEGNGAPGHCHAFFPMKSSLDPEKRIKPMIILSGDDDGNIYLFDSQFHSNPYDWTYTNSSIFYAKGTVGSPALKDVDNDGYMEVFIPAYTEGQIHTYTFKP